MESCRTCSWFDPTNASKQETERHDAVATIERDEVTVRCKGKDGVVMQVRHNTIRRQKTPCSTVYYAFLTMLTTFLPSNFIVERRLKWGRSTPGSAYYQRHLSCCDSDIMDYSAVSGAGKLKLKGVNDSKIDKKKKKKKPTAAAEDATEDHSVMLKKLEDEDEQITKKDRRKMGVVDGQDVVPGAGEKDEMIAESLKTEAERRHDEQRRKRLEDRLKKEGVKTHKQRVEELNRYLSGLSEHHDMPKIGPG